MRRDGEVARPGARGCDEPCGVADETARRQRISRRLWRRRDTCLVRRAWIEARIEDRGQKCRTSTGAPEAALCRCMASPIWADVERRLRSREAGRSQTALPGGVSRAMYRTLTPPCG